MGANPLRYRRLVDLSLQVVERDGWTVTRLPVGRDGLVAVAVTVEARRMACDATAMKWALLRQSTRV
mgnify:CR=1 FL=1